MEIRTALNLAKRIQAISQTGLTYCKESFDIDRYEELQQISHELIHLLTGVEPKKIANFFMNEKEYPTPKTDVRAVIFNEQHEILLVREKSDNRWALPGGWADIGLSPREVVVKEVREETGLIAVPRKLLALLDKKLHPHTPEIDYAYKLFIECSVTGGELGGAHDIVDVAYFAKDNIPPLSEIRVVPSQISLMFEFHENPDKEVVFD